MGFWGFGVYHINHQWYQNTISGTKTPSVVPHEMKDNTESEDSESELSLEEGSSSEDKLTESNIRVDRRRKPLKNKKRSKKILKK